MKKIFTINISAFCFIFFNLGFNYAQDYTSYFTGNTQDFQGSPQGGICLMGGATEDDEAMKWFLNRADGGDVLVLRASGSDGYNNYFYSGLGVSLNSVETIVFNNSQASQDSYIQDRISKAEAIWFAGGDQWNYISYWRNSPIQTLINDAIVDRNIVIGGTSAGMAILGGAYFTAENSTVTSTQALQDPFNVNLTVDNAEFINLPFLSDVITDTHYDNPDRRGRHVVFLSRLLLDHGDEYKGIACDDYTAVCIDENGKANVFGDYPSYDDNSYFLQINCEVEDNFPETLQAGAPLTWTMAQNAIKVYRIKGTQNGSGFLDLNDWKTGSGGDWFHWYVNDGVLEEVAASALNCESLNTIDFNDKLQVKLFPNPTDNLLTISTDSGNVKVLQCTDLLGRTVEYDVLVKSPTESVVNVVDFAPGIYTIVIEGNNSISNYSFKKY